MIRRLIAIAILGTSLDGGAATPPANLAGQWTFEPSQSKNVGMMGGMKIHTTIVQSLSELVVDDASDFNGRQDTQHTSYDLTGKHVSNTPIMGGTATTRSHWDGTRLVTEWESPGSIAGTTVKRTETRYLSPDGSTMFIESSRPGQEPMVMVFTRDR
jgi:hypothetical protein